MEAPKEIYLTFTNNGHIVESDEPIPGNQSVKYIRADMAELSWEDIKKINDLMVVVANKFNHLEVFTEKFFVEVLRRFLESKGNKA